MLVRLALCLFFLFMVTKCSAEELHDRQYWIARYLSVSYPLKNVQVSSAFGSRKDPFTGKVSFHSGLDLKAKYEIVYSMFDGVVEAIGSNKRSGNHIIIRHGSYTVSYCHLSRRYVEPGEKVYAGMPVAVSGNTGRSTGAHLHLTVMKDGKITDPSVLLRFVSEVRRESCKALGSEPSVEFCMSQDEFIESYHDKAMQHQRKYGIPASVTLAQMAYESNWGRSELARVGKNYFGVKCSRQWLAEGRPYSLYDDDEQNEKFCNYESAYESMEHHAHILMGKNYESCRKYSQTDYHGWLMALKKAGYATNPSYVKDCESIIMKYKLYQYDRLAMDIRS